eukprot:TRINITY_DN3740_c0_g2_i1.p1 TRINITY_DN3740_c0_g2~~TRINITY_DN3740_c0_g2_i1.p1  ORF type:complete len:119 (+),score=21.07 TRINITY_DN3740_c0_g2_i1:546-902(+)
MRACREGLRMKIKSITGSVDPGHLKFYLDQGARVQENFGLGSSRNNSPSVVRIVKDLYQENLFSSDDSDSYEIFEGFGGGGGGGGGDLGTTIPVLIFLSAVCFYGLWKFFHWSQVNQN